jgi:hypothetical protein
MCSSDDFLNWSDLDLDELLGEYTDDFYSDKNASTSSYSSTDEGLCTEDVGAVADTKAADDTTALKSELICLTFNCNFVRMNTGASISPRQWTQYSSLAI